jgi:hypothetical protein
MSRKTALIALATLMTATPFGVLDHEQPVSTPPAVIAEPVVTGPTITYLDAPSDDQRRVVEWAVARYAEAGLQLPDLAISFPVTCGGKAGRYLVGRNTIELCRPHRKLVLHELAHAWDDNSSLDRVAFLRKRGLDDWYEQPGQRSNESGGEQLALVLTWGLMDIDITHPVAESAELPIDEGRRQLPGLADGTPRVLTELFVQLTGTSPLTPAAFIADSDHVSSAQVAPPTSPASQ